MSIDYRIGDGRDLIRAVPDGSVSLVACSPPFLALRSYLPGDHEHKHAEIGSEPTPADFLDTLLSLTAEWGRVLAPWGSIAIELGDTYAGHDNRGSSVDAGKHDAKIASITTGAGWPMAKSLALIPQLYAIALAYGINPFTGQPSPAGRWRVRNVIVWHRPNPVVGALGDKYRPSTSYIVVATRSPKRWFDLTAVRGEGSPNTHARTAKGVDARETTGKRAASDGNFDTLATQHLGAPGAPPLDCWTDPWDGEHDTWTITTQPSSLAHYAMWPAKLAERLVLSMCPAEVCATCGEPRRRMETATYVPHGDPERQNAESRAQRGAAERGVNGSAQQFANGRATKIPTTIGWTDCGHNDYRPGVTLDPFAGTGTTPIVAHLHGRTGIGFDLDPRNADLVPAREAEVRRNLFGTKPELPGQLGLALP